MSFKRKIALMLTTVFLFSAVPVFGEETKPPVGIEEEIVVEELEEEIIEEEEEIVVEELVEEEAPQMQAFGFAPFAATVGTFADLELALDNNETDIVISAQILLPDDFKLENVTITAATKDINLLRVVGNNVTIKDVTFNTSGDEAENVTAIVVAKGADGTLIEDCNFNMPKWNTASPNKNSAAVGINTAPGFGALTIKGNTFVGNDLKSRTPMYIDIAIDGSEVIIDTNIITGIFRNPTNIQTKVTLTNNTFSPKTDYMYSVNDGTAVYFRGDKVTLSTVTGNTFTKVEGNPSSSPIIGINSGSSTVPSTITFESFENNTFVDEKPNAEKGIPAVKVAAGGEGAFVDVKGDNINGFNIFDKNIFYYSPSAKVTIVFKDKDGNEFSDLEIIKEILLKLTSTPELKDPYEDDEIGIRYTTPTPADGTLHQLVLDFEKEGYTIELDNSTPTILIDGLSEILIIVTKKPILTLNNIDNIDLTGATITVTGPDGEAVKVPAEELQYYVEKDKEYTITVTLEGYEDYTSETTGVIAGDLSLDIKLVKKLILTIRPIDKDGKASLPNATITVKDSTGKEIKPSPTKFQYYVEKGVSYTITAKLSGYDDANIAVGPITGNESKDIELGKTPVVVIEEETTTGGTTSGSGGIIAGGSKPSGDGTTILDPEVPLGTGNKFIDIPAKLDWAKDAIYKLVERGLVTGLTENTYAPEKTFTRAEFAVIVTKLYDLTLLGETKNYADVKSGNWYYDFINIASSHGFLTGYEDGEFKPDQAISRQEMAYVVSLFIAKYNYELPVVSNKTLTDMDDVHGYAKAAVQLLVNAGIINGYEDGSFQPNGYITRAEAAVLIERFIAAAKIK